MELHPRRLGGPAQGGHHRFGAIGTGKHPPIGLLHQLQAMVIKPSHRIAGSKTAKGPAQGLAPPGVVAHQGARIPAGMGDIAAPTTANQHFVEGLKRGLQQVHIGGPGFCCCNGRHESGRPATGHQHSDATREHG